MNVSEKNLTPLMKQYWEIKTLHQDKILMFRMGDFFEMFYDDAVKAAPLLGIALTQRNKKSADETPMCGMPHHSVAGPINKLLSHGLKVAICDQIEDPKLAKGIVKRAVTRVLTPGMVFDSDTLDSTQAHYLASMDENSLSLVDTTTGEAFYFKSNDIKSLLNYLEILPIAELILSSEEKTLIEKIKINSTVSFHDEIVDSQNQLFSGKLNSKAPHSAKRLLSYIYSLSQEDIFKTLSPFEEKNLVSRLSLSSTTLRHLEIFSTYKGDENGSLYKAIRKTQTSQGSRLLRQWMSFPLTDLSLINQRQNEIKFWRQHLTELKRLRQILAQMGDIERRLGKISQPQCHGRDLLALSQSVNAGLSILELMKSLGKSPTESSPFSLETLHNTSLKIESTFVEDPPLTVKQGYMIKDGVHAALDELIMLTTQSQTLLLKMENEEKEKTGISSLKIRYNNVFGYYIEVTNTHKDKVPSYYQRKQTLSNAERYCTDELIELERKVLSAQSKRADLEFEIFDQVRKTVLSEASHFLQLAHLCSEIDVLSSLAWLSLEENYCAPVFNQNQFLSIKGSRHPVVEQFIRGQFVANDIELQPHACMLLTGPNMAGKSTLMRQVALTVILAQMGSFVPASEAELPLFNDIYTRIGASDQLSEGLSTFMVEMTETSQMLKDCSENSLVVLDEVGRGTSTFDGMCLAQSILEFLLTEKKAMTLFATHYHELTALESHYPQLKNAHMTVSDRGGEVKFLHSLVRGPALKSYGIQVAQLAGLPTRVTQRAKALLKDIESRSSHQATSQMSFMDLEVQHEVIDEVKSNPEWDKALSFVEQVQKFNLQDQTPIQALNQIAKWQQDLQQWKV